MKPMVRYNKGTNGHKRAVLFTFRSEDNNTIFFGVSRCNKKDKFDKELGVEIAFNRALRAKNMFNRGVKNINFVENKREKNGLLNAVDHFFITLNNVNFYSAKNNNGFVRHSDNFGFVEVSNVRSLLEWFRGL